MKQIKAFIHPHRISAVTEALRNSGLCDISNGGSCHHLTVSTVQRLYTSINSSEQHYSLDLAEPVVAESKLELICADEFAPQLIELIVEAAKPSQGWVFSTTIETAIKIG